MADKYRDPVTGILHNKFAISDVTTLAKVEAQSAAAAAQHWVDKPESNRFDLDHLRQIHKRLFEKVYERAGEVKDGNWKKGDSHFTHGSQVEAASKTVFDSLAQEKHLAGLTREQFADRAAHYLNEVNSIHAFREGNGRAQRVFIEQLGRQAGHEFSFNGITSERMIDVSVKAHEGRDLEPMKRMFTELLDHDRAKALREAMPFATKALREHGIDANYHYISTAIPGQTYGGNLLAANDKQFIALENTRIYVGQVKDLPKDMRLTLDAEIKPFTASRYGLERQGELAMQAGSVAEAHRTYDADRERLSRLERSYPEGHDRHAAIGQARVMLSTLEKATIQRTAVVELRNDAKERSPGTVTQKTHHDGLSLVQRSVHAAERAGMTIHHELKAQWQAQAQKPHEHSKDHAKESSR